MSSNPNYHVAPIATKISAACPLCGITHDIPRLTDWRVRRAVDEQQLCVACAEREVPELAALAQRLTALELPRDERTRVVAGNTIRGNPLFPTDQPEDAITCGTPIAGGLCVNPISQRRWEIGHRENSMTDRCRGRCADCWSRYHPTLHAYLDGRELPKPPVPPAPPPAPTPEEIRQAARDRAVDTIARAIHGRDPSNNRLSPRDAAELLATGVEQIISLSNESEASRV